MIISERKLYGDQSYSYTTGNYKIIYWNSNSKIIPIIGVDVILATIITIVACEKNK